MLCSTSPPRGRVCCITPLGLKAGLNLLRIAGLPQIVGCAVLSGCALVVARVERPLVAGQDGPAGGPAEGSMAGHASQQMGTHFKRATAFPGDSVPAPKITVPNVPGWALRRPRITTLITQGMRRCPLTIVTGPLGAGKTMALAVWAAEPGPVAWVSVDEYDNRPGAFWSYVVAALRRS